MSAPRRTAYDVLAAVAGRGAYANLLLPRLLRERGTTGRDAALATELTYGALRAQGTLDAILARCVDRPLDTLDAPVRAVLRLGAYQLLATRIPAYAAVSATVELARAVAGGGPARLVNAVLHRVAEHDMEHWLAVVAPAPDADPVGHLALRHAHPAWVVRAFAAALGGDLDEVAAALAADNVAAPVHLVARPGRMTRAELLAESGGTPGPWSPYAVRMAGGDPGGLPAVRAGRAGVQDEGSQLAVLALVAAPLDGPDERWLDLGAGPGGKTALLAGLAANRGAKVLAVEQHPHRARLVAQATAGQPAEVRIGDGTDPATLEPGQYDRVLLDAPCTGLGALRRRPEARWRRTPADVPRLAALQRSLLAAALRAARPGGVVAYVTCSPHLAETADVVRPAVEERRAEPVDARASLGPVEALGPGPYVQLWPHRHGTDAMFVGLLRRRPDPHRRA